MHMLDKNKKSITNKNIDIFDKCYDFDRADKLKLTGLYPYFHPIQESEGPVVTIDGREVVMAGSNNYLGLTAHPKVKEASIKAIEKYGTGCSGSRYLTGTLDLHIELEDRLAKFLGKEAVLLFSTGYQTALGTIATLVQKGDYVISDRENHACIISAGMLAKGGYAHFVRYKHNDIDDLESIISKLPEGSGKLVVTDGVFSVTGSIANLVKLVEICEKYNARLLVDDAHSIGVIGKGGRGTASHFGLTDRVDLIMGTFSKTFASLGGFIAGSERVINYIKHFSPALIFSASPTPASCAAALAALDILEAEPERVNKLIENSNYIRENFKNMNFNLILSETAIVPVVIGDEDKTFIFWRKLFDNGVFVNAFVPPGVPINLSMMRTSYMALHEKQHLDKVLDVFESTGKSIGII